MSHKKGLKIPLVVHCSAGVGRTGTFIILDTIMDRLRSEDSINVYELLLAMRKQRMHMVQTQVTLIVCVLVSVHVMQYCRTCT